MTRDEVIEYFKTLDADRRVKLLGDIGLLYCEHCGYEQPKSGYCQCNNDE